MAKKGKLTEQAFCSNLSTASGGNELQVLKKDGDWQKENLSEKC